jgi:hypothetical protein
MSCFSHVAPIGRIATKLGIFADINMINVAKFQFLQGRVDVLHGSKFSCHGKAMPSTTMHCATAHACDYSVA